MKGRRGGGEEGRRGARGGRGGGEIVQSPLTNLTFLSFSLSHYLFFPLLLLLFTTLQDIPQKMVWPLRLYRSEDLQDNEVTVRAKEEKEKIEGRDEKRTTTEYTCTNSFLSFSFICFSFLFFSSLSFLFFCFSIPPTCTVI